MKVIERDLLILAMIRKFSDQTLNQLIPNVDNVNLVKLHEATFKDDGSINDIVQQLANETYGKVRKKFKQWGEWMRMYKLGDVVKVNGYGDIEFEIQRIDSFLYHNKGGRKEGIFYSVSGKRGLTLSIYPEQIVEDKPVQSIDELLDTYNSYLKLEEICMEGNYREAADIVMEEIQRLYAK